MRYSNLRYATDPATFERECSFVKAAALNTGVPHQRSELWGHASYHNFVIANSWLDITTQLTCLWGPEMGRGTRVSGTRVSLDLLIYPPIFDSIWKRIDAELWRSAKSLDKPGHSGLVAKTFGLIDPSAPDRPTCTEHIFKSLQAEAEAIAQGKTSQLKAEMTPAPVTTYTNTIPVAGPTESAAQSGHKFVSEQQELKGKEKSKTRGTAAVPSGDMAQLQIEDDASEIENLPDFLPANYKMGRKVLKVRYYYYCKL